MGFDLSDPHVKNALNCQLQVPMPAGEDSVFGWLSPQVPSGHWVTAPAWAGLEWAPLGECLCECAVPWKTLEEGIRTLFIGPEVKIQNLLLQEATRSHHWMLEKGHTLQRRTEFLISIRPGFLEMKSVCHLFPRHWSLIMSHSVPRRLLAVDSQELICSHPWLFFSLGQMVSGSQHMYWIRRKGELATVEASVRPDVWLVETKECNGTDQRCFFHALDYSRGISPLPVVLCDATLFLPALW